MNKFSVFLLAISLTFVSMGLVFAQTVPFGATTVSEVASSTAVGGGAADSHNAIAGNVTEINITGDSVTQSWQGYYGNVSGTMTLENSGGDVMYNWSGATPEGEVFASNESSVTWSSIGCFAAADVAGLESFYNIASDDGDGVNETFSNATAHDAFDVGTVSFAADACLAAFIFDSTKAGVDNNFEEVLLSDGVKHVFAAILEPTTTFGFDGEAYNFEMLVLEDGHSGDASTTPYYFYVELG